MNCIDGLCQSPTGYLKNQEEINCLKPCTTYQDYCSYESTCNVKLGKECIHYRCQCQRNYKYSEAVKKCLYFTFKGSGDCQTYYYNRECHNDRCVCKLYIIIGIVIICGLITGFAKAIRHSPRSRSRRVGRMNRTIQVDCGSSRDG